MRYSQLRPSFDFHIPRKRLKSNSGGCTLRTDQVPRSPMP